MRRVAFRRVATACILFFCPASLGLGGACGGTSDAPNSRANQPGGAGATAGGKSAGETGGGKNQQGSAGTSGHSVGTSGDELSHGSSGGSAAAGRNDGAGAKVSADAGGRTGAGGALAGGGGSARAGAPGEEAAGGGSSHRGGGAGTGGSQAGAAGNVGPKGGESGSGGAAGGTGTPTGKCGSTSLNQHPFGCDFAWGVADPGGSLASFSYVQFVSYWVDSTISASGTFTTCNACSWLTGQVSKTNLIPVYYAYLIGFLGHANGIVDGNQTGSKKLTTDGAQLIRDHRDAIVQAYAWYAQQTYKVWSTKPLVWLLEGDFVQFVDSGQKNALSMAELGTLASDITCAIKSNMPNAVVAIDHSTWNGNDLTDQFWAAMKSVNYDLVWTTGVGNNNGYFNSDATSSSYNAKTATYSYVHKLTGKTILVDTSAGASAAGDSWSTASTADLNARIAEGVIAANITGTAPNGLQSNITKLAPSLTGIPDCK